MLVYQNGKLMCEGVSISSIAAKVGTPFYVYSQKTFMENFRRIKGAFSPARPIIAYSVKANSNLTILRLLAKAGSGFDVVSGGELRRVLLAGGDPGKVIFAGVGKTAVVEGLAARIRTGDIPPELQECHIFAVEANQLMAGTEYRGSLEKRLQDLIEELENHPRLIIFIDEIHQLFSRGGANNPAEALKPALSRGRFRCIGATTNADYHRYLAGDEAFARRFNIIRVEEPAVADVEMILAGIKKNLEVHHHLNISEEIVKKTVGMAAEYLPNRRFPDKALDLLDRACTLAHRHGREAVSEADIRSVVAEIIGVEFTEDSPVFLRRLADLDTLLAKEVLGQDKAITAVVNTVRLCKKRLDLRPERPDGVFLFLGPTGTGKTALAEALAVALTGRSEKLIRLDMSEYAESHTVSRLIGSPAGYVGYDDEPYLLAQLKKHPNGVLLLDEFEKAHPQVHLLFLQAFDSGRLTDARGSTYSLANIIIIATANIRLQKQSATGFLSLGKDMGGTEAGSMFDHLCDYFPPELVNRFDEIVPFQPLSGSIIRKIIRQKILPLANQNLEKNCGLSLELKEDLEDLIINRGTSDKFGVRNLHRTFEEMVLKPFASEYLGPRQDEKFCDDDARVIIQANYDADREKVVFSPVAP